mgnify:FL=1
MPIFDGKYRFLRQKGGLIAYLRPMFPLVGDYQTKALSPIREYFNQKERLHEILLTHMRMYFKGVASGTVDLYNRLFICISVKHISTFAKK